MKRVMLMVMLLCIGWGIKAQNLIYVNLDKGSDSGSGGIATPYLSLKKALSVATAPSEVRLMIREDGKKAVYTVDGELTIPRDVKVVGGYNIRGEQIAGAALNIIVQGDSTSRIFKVAGTLEGVTVTGGKCKGGNGGGVYVLSGGKVLNCIITDNVASYQLPKVGDLLMKDGTYMDVSLFTYDQVNDLKGVVFWVNPDKSAVSPKGWAVSPYFAQEKEWWTGDNSGVTGTDASYFLTLQDALRDMDGKSNTQRFAGNAGCAVIQDCLNFGDSKDFYLPSLGQLYCLLVGWSEVEDAFAKLWGVIQPKQELAVIQGLFGPSARAYSKKTVWSETQHFMHLRSCLVSSTLKDKKNIWVLYDLYEKSYIDGQAANLTHQYIYVTEF